MAIDSSISPARCFASATFRSSSALMVASDIPTLAIPAVCVPTAIELLRPLEFDEALDLFLCGGAESLQLVEESLFPVAFLEELADVQVERTEDLQQRVEADLVLALLHAGEIGLMDADLVGELHLRQFSLTAKLPDLAPDELELRWLVHAGFVDFLCY